MKKDIERKVRCLNQQKLVFEAENQILKKNLQELQTIKIKYDNIINSRKYKLLDVLSGNHVSEESILGVNGEN